MKSFLWVLLLIGFNLLIAYVISFYSLTIAIGWFFLGVGFQFGQWYGKGKKEEEFIVREEMIRSEYKKGKHES